MKQVDIDLLKPGKIIIYSSAYETSWMTAMYAIVVDCVYDESLIYDQYIKMKKLKQEQCIIEFIVICATEQRLSTRTIPPFKHFKVSFRLSESDTKGRDIFKLDYTKISRYINRNPFL
jgi:hypothetical protein